MRCAMDFDENKKLSDQNVAAWGENQSLQEEPAYKEEDIKHEESKEFFRGYKMALDDMCKELEFEVGEGIISNRQSDMTQALVCSDLCMLLFSILDNESCEEDS